MSKAEGYYYHCPKCRQWVPATRRRCSCGQFLDHLTPVPRAGESAPELDEKAVEDETTEPSMYCMRCNRTFATYKRECPVCGGILQIAGKEWQAKSAKLPDEMPEEEYGEAETEVLLDEYEEEEQERKPLFYFNACRYDNGAAIRANTGNIAVDAAGQQKLLLGRNFFVREPQLFFTAGNREIDERYRTISRNNALLYVEDGRLYIEMYREHGAGKAPVYVNDEKLGETEIRELHHGDRVRFGGRKAVHDGTIDIEIVSAKEKDNCERNREEKEEGSLAEVKGMVAKLFEGVTKMQGDLKSIQEVVSQINPADLTVRRGEDAESYENRLAASVPEAAYPTREECVARFLEAVLSKDSPVYREKMAFFEENDQRFHLLYQAAFFENACVANGLEDYAGPMSFLGKAMEGFVMGEIAEVVKTFHGEAYGNLVERKGNRIVQSDILSACRANGGISVILQAAGYDEAERRKMQGRVNNALSVLHSVRVARNDASHCNPDTEAPAENRVNVITGERYGEVKRNLLTSDAIEVMHGLYLRAKKAQEQA